MNNTYKNLILSLLFATSSEAKELYNLNIKEISKEFLGKEYKANTLIGSNNKKEQLVINLEQVDCFTYLDYVTAFNESINKNEFEKNLIKLRYKNSKISYENRNHFFTDWIKNNSYKNISSYFSQTQSITKLLNKNGSSVYLKGLDIKKRTIEFIPHKNISLLDYTKFKDGDLIGIYSDKEGLDVTHVGFAIIKDITVYLRHASLTYKKVIDEKLDDYLKNKKGLIVLRRN